MHRRLFAGATRRAAEMKDRECFHQFCDQPAADCEIDHFQPWSEGGLTIDENGRPACSRHNRRRQRGEVAAVEGGGAADASCNCKEADADP